MQVNWNNYDNWKTYTVFYRRENCTSSTVVRADSKEHAAELVKKAFGDSCKEVTSVIVGQ